MTARPIAYSDSSITFLLCAGVESIDGQLNAVKWTKIEVFCVHKQRRILGIRCNDFITTITRQSNLLGYV